jgi:hypothetical protein
MATLDGYPIFGGAVSMMTADNTRDRQKNIYVGINGIEALDQGLHGRYTTVSGRFVETAGGVGAIASAEAAFRGFNDGQTHTLVDTMGTTWLNVMLESFEPQGKVELWGNGYTSRRYTARFLHLT